MICLWIPQTVLYSAKTVAGSAVLPVFGAVLAVHCFLVFVCGIQNSNEDQRKVELLRIPQQSDFGLLRNPFAMHRMHSLAS